MWLVGAYLAIAIIILKDQNNREDLEELTCFVWDDGFCDK